MRRYNIRIDGEVMPKSYTYEELRQNGVLDFDDIEVKLVSGSSWSTIKSYCFPEEKGAITSAKPQQAGDSRQNGFYINEFGEVVSNTNIGGGSSSSSESGSSGTPSGSNPSSPNPSSPNPSSRPSVGCGFFIRLILTLLVIAFLIGLLADGQITFSLASLIPAIFIISKIWSIGKD